MALTKKSDRLGTEPIIPLLIKLSVPGIIGMLIQSFYNIIDSIYIGRLSKEALSAVSLSFPIQLLLIALAVGTGVGTTSLISRLLGKGENHRANNAAEHAFVIGIFYAILVAISGIYFTEDLISLFTDNLLLIKLATRYTKIILVGSIALFIPMIANNVLRGEGNTFVPMLTMLIGAVLNIILDPFMIFGLWVFPELGIEGAAYATIISRFISGIFIAFVLFSDKNQLKLNLKDFKFEPQIIIDIYKVGLPAMALQLSASAMVAGVNKIVEPYSPLAIAVFGIYFRLQSFIFLPIIGLSQGYMPIVGYNYGHGKPDRMKKTIKAGLIFSSIVTIIGFVIFQVFPRELIILFNDDPKLIKIGVTALKRITLAYPIMGAALIASTTFQAIGKGIPSLIHSTFRQVVLLFPIMYLIGEYYGLATLWFAIPIAELLAAIIVITWLVLELRRVFNRMKEK
ncbi:MULTISPECIES: MATE family efflux transporter [unclassified Candidatus Frackibacter]|uniref:MATE family efflux transporter n=1 Tax=unclassified Candidatus Frackibacter TaxID=2648818 RepID=UPI0007922714|nr:MULTISPECIES: MATE family efflux transporter [unclassified Candidatus Frackibacter]KXS40369.1 MAG: MATE efflux family protein [Candidatus Frackibacter sp. T328-2]SDC68200.1 putative efflux protein, MATE family [Candidatus Frackibacter sp. WG11]SEM83441.1 putative efflux protein, MATE family [Candidatus Frackibacter sp. WG12]SFL91819.1 putative efflux protein, MATE family [Candidatus Frackibacter sp. WG13]